MVVSADGRRGIDRYPGNPRIFEIATGKQIASLRSDFSDLAISGDGRRVITTEKDGTARIWDAEVGTELVKLPKHDVAIGRVLFSPDGRRVATTAGAKIHIWDTQTGSAVVSMTAQKDPKGGVWSLAFSPDSKRLATASPDRTARIWDVETGAEIAVLKGHESQVLEVQYASDGRRLLTRSWDNTVRLWDSAGGAEIAMVPGSEAAALAPDGRSMIAAAADDATSARIWPVFPTTDELVEYARKVQPRPLTPAQRDQFFLTPPS
jgi:dipeptidyl aminopeptidase/acylaminoacyl peptidase